MQHMLPEVRARLPHLTALYDLIRGMVKDYLDVFVPDRQHIDEEALSFLAECARGIPRLEESMDELVADFVFMVTVVHSLDHWNTFMHFPLDIYPSRAADHVLIKASSVADIRSSIKKMYSTMATIVGPVLPVNSMRYGYRRRIGHDEGQSVLDSFQRTLQAYIAQYPGDPFLQIIMRSNVYRVIGLT